MIISCTGHRPDKLPNKETGYKLPNPTYNFICQQIEKILLELKPEKGISGMALGSDQYFANICLKLNIPLIAAIPFKGQELAWTVSSQKIYYQLLKKASQQIIVCEGSYSSEKMQIRNEYLVDHCDILMAVFNGEKSGGTYKCIKYAESIHKKIIYIKISP